MDLSSQKDMKTVTVSPSMYLRAAFRLALLILSSAALTQTTVQRAVPPPVSSAGVASAAPAAPRTHTVLIRMYKYVPAVLTVSSGDVVVWKNEDNVPHSVTTVEKGFDSGYIATGTSWKFTVGKTGELFYYCTYHPNMKAKLVVR